jgi:hypothetical protein
MRFSQTSWTAVPKAQTSLSYQHKLSYNNKDIDSNSLKQKMKRVAYKPLFFVTPYYDIEMRFSQVLY